MQETPINEIHVMGGQGFGVAGNQKTNELERQARQMNGYPLRSFLATGGAVVLPNKYTEGLMATPHNRGLPQYTQYNGVISNYASSFTEPLYSPMDSGQILLAKMGIQAKSESISNPYKYLQFQLNMHKTQEEIKALEEKHLQLRAYNQEGNIQKAYEGHKKHKGEVHAVHKAAHHVKQQGTTVQNVVHGTGAVESPAVASAVKQALSENVLMAEERQSTETAANLDRIIQAISNATEIDASNQSALALVEASGLEEEEEEPYTPQSGVSTMGGEMTRVESAQIRRRESEQAFMEIGLLEDAYPAIDSDTVYNVYSQNGSDFQAANAELMRIQNNNMYNSASTIAVSQTPDATVTKLGLANSDDPSDYRNTIDPKFESTVFNVLTLRKNLFQGQAVDFNSPATAGDLGATPPSKWSEQENKRLSMTNTPPENQLRNLKTEVPHGDSPASASSLILEGLPQAAASGKMPVYQIVEEETVNVRKVRKPITRSMSQQQRLGQAKQGGTYVEEMTSPKGNKLRINLPIGFED